MNKRRVLILVGVFLFSLTLVGVVNAQKKSIDPANASITLNEEIDDELVCSGEIIHPALEDLSEQYDVDYEELLPYFCEKELGIGDIKHALMTATREDVEMDYQQLLDWVYTDGMSWGEIWQQLGLIGMGEFESHDEVAGETSLVCSGDWMHPVLNRLAEDFNVAYETLLTYFCEEGYGIGELIHALKSAQDEDVEESWMDLLEARDGDEDTKKNGWGVIWQNLGLIGKDKHGKDRIWPDFMKAFQERIENNIGKNKPEGHPGRGKGLGK